MRTRRRFILGSATGVALLALTAWAQVLDLPPRAPNALSGSEFARRVAMLDLGERDREVYAQVMAGNVPDFLRRLCPVPARSVVEGRINSGTYYVTPDYLAVGSDDDYFLAPISPYTAQRIAEALHCTLPTPKMVNPARTAFQSPVFLASLISRE